MNSKIDKLIKQFAKLPRLGTRAGQRIVLALLQDKTGRAISLANALLDAANSVKPCSICGVLTDAEDTCATFVVIHRGQMVRFVSFVIYLMFGLWKNLPFFMVVIIS